MKIAIIPARGGSKRIPRKNIRLFHGKPIIAWSIEAAIKSGIFDEIIVSTDDQEIAAIANQYGAETPFVRPEELANDHAGTLPVISHALNWMNENVQSYDYACCIYATVPFLRSSDLIAAHDRLIETSADFVITAAKFSYPIQRALKLDQQNQVSMFSPEYEQTRSQDLTEAFHDAGQFYWGTRQAWTQRSNIYSSNCLAHRIPEERMQDIDCEDDWRIAEMKFDLLHRI
jgi:pseudaminic acid cytidylyltransferase